ncbi:MAG: zf-HC2 domain-containing protein [Polyangiaceae bacterium]
MSGEQCQPFRHLLGAYVDGQLEPETVLSIEAHLDTCSDCRERCAFKSAMRGSLKRAVRGETMNDGARARLAAALEAVRAETEAERVAATTAPLDLSRPTDTAAVVPFDPPARARPAGLRGLAMRSAVPLTAAAAMALLWGASAHGPFTHAALSGVATADAAGSKELLDELVHEHSLPLPPERTDPKDLREFERYVGVPVRPRVFEKQQNARLVGGRVLPMHQERAAMLQYEVGSGADAKRVSVLIYDPRKIQVGSADLAPRTVGTSEVRVGRERGYSVAVTQRDGVGYALAADLDTERSAQFVNFVVDEP